MSTVRFAGITIVKIAVPAIAVDARRTEGVLARSGDSKPVPEAESGLASRQTIGHR